ncbi:MAG: metallophosphoesterase family protein [Trueperaceae bacterium]
MKIAVLADVHGNLPALEAVLVDAQEQGAVQLVINGDMVNRGPQNVAVLERLAETKAPLLLGNHDDLLRMWIDRDGGLPTSWFGDPFWEGTAWCARQLERDGWINRLRELPMTYRAELPDAPQVLIAHGSPRHYREGYSRLLSDEDIEQIASEYGAELLVGSHTHIPMRRRHGNIMVLNSGAVGAPFNGDPRAQYLLLTLTTNGWQPEFRKVPYDRERSLRAFEESGYLEEGGLSAHIFFEELRLARSLLTPFLLWIESSDPTLKAVLDEEGWQRFRQAVPERFEEPTTSST